MEFSPDMILTFYLLESSESILYRPLPWKALELPLYLWISFLQLVKTVIWLQGFRLCFVRIQSTSRINEDEDNFIRGQRAWHRRIW